MKLEFQTSAINELKQLAENDCHSILIEGSIGCGKSYLAKMYGQLKHIEDFASVPPTVQGIRDALEASYNLASPVVFCIENLDLGVPGASFTLLKFLEEPVDNVYIVVTCRNRFHVPDTIISRSICVTVSSLLDKHVTAYAQIRDNVKFNNLHTKAVWRGVKTLNDVEDVFRMTSAQIAYYDELSTTLNFKDTVSSLMWQLGHYPDNTETNIQFVFNYIIAIAPTARIQRYAIQCVKDLIQSRIASHAVIAKFIFECKYGE